MAIKISNLIINDRRNLVNVAELKTITSITTPIDLKDNGLITVLLFQQLQVCKQSEYTYA
jgi:hypothetical protein